MLIKQKFSKKYFVEHLENTSFTRRIDKIVLHHTWKPTVKQWMKYGGQYWMDFFEDYYLRQKGWPAGPHIFCAPDGIWMFTPLKDRGVHAGQGNLNSIGVEMVGDYSMKKPTGKVLANTVHVLKSLLLRFELGRRDIHLHRQYAFKASGCPGWRIGRKWINQNVIFNT